MKRAPIIGDQILGYVGDSVLLKDRSFAMTMAKVGGGAFELLSADVGQDFANPGPATGVIVTGFFSGGGSTSATVPMPTGSLLFTHALFSGFTNLTEVTFQGTGNSSPDSNANGFVLDNIETTTNPVPVPSTAVLLGSLLPLAFFCRRAAVGIAFCPG